MILTLYSFLCLGMTVIWSISDFIKFIHNPKSNPFVERWFKRSVLSIFYWIALVSAFIALYFGIKLLNK